MPDFRYRGRDSSGQLTSGTVEAANEGAAADNLLRRGVTPLDISLVPAATSTGIEFKLFQPKVTSDDLIVFTRQMYALTKAGIPLLRAIEGLAENTSNKKLSVVLHDVVESLERGRQLSAAMAAHPRVFPRLLVSIVHVGENTGQLEQAFEQLSEYLAREQETAKQVKTALRYPMFISVALVAAMFILNIFVIPTFASMFKRFDVELPLATRLLIGTSDFFVAWWPAMLLAGAAAFIMTRRYVRSDSGRVRWDYFKIQLPLVGDIVLRSLLSRFSRSFAVMLRAGVPLTQALSLVAEAVDNSWMGKRINDMRRSIERGESLTRATRASQLFTPLVLQMIAVGEETGRVDELLHEVADYYEREVDYDLKSLTARIEPIMLIIVAVVIAVMALGIFMPMWDMMSAYQGG
ncbi:type II secretion system F family protein [Pseudidiomarina sp.]|uniref:type II secretion system F family protein n=1 Tax=Pseudidiomarina sp. TaxID=2081707 RepID=UPI00299D2784|nr:type II secretion system F family protein [Pseudidiomarina sp.]MDX1706305.1 type II secretion system F family protein [Pseudidiomarina sp.]